MKGLSRRPCAVAATGFALLLAGGCARWQTSAKLALPAIQTPPDSVALEILFIQFPFGDPEINGPLWTEIDEQEIDTALRQRLDANGIRAGVISGQLPAALERLINPPDEAPKKVAADPDLVDVRKRPTSRGRRLQVTAGEPFLIPVTGDKERHESLTILTRNEAGEVEGRTFTKVRGVFDAKAFALSDGRVRLELEPQIEYGDAKQQFAHGEGGSLQIRLAPSREVYQSLRLEAVVSRGQMLVLSSAPDRLGSLGRHYFSEEIEGSREQKLLLIRLANSGTPDAKVSPPPAPSDED
jgi:hypothetical protein